MTFSSQMFAQHVQSIRGVVKDKVSTLPLEFVQVSINNMEPKRGAFTDSTGGFIINDVPVGRYELRVSLIGYQTKLIYNIDVISSKETFLTVELSESFADLDEVVVKPKVDKSTSNNSMVILGSHLLSVEEAQLFAGGFDDPARLASAMAGVASNSSENGIIVRGNAPKFLQWRLEGIEIPNPNHFADLNSLGGGTLTALSAQVLGNSDFLTGAFPAEYNNALSGVFDIKMRKGNNQEYSHTFQLGLLGIDISSEGPLKKEGKASYVFNYRYSTLALAESFLPEGAGSIIYEDLSFKLNFPTKKAGVFNLWGLGMTDGASARAKTDSTDWQYSDDRQRDVINQRMGVIGIHHKFYFKKNSYLNSTLAATGIRTNWSVERLDNLLELQPESNIKSRNSRMILSSYFNKKFSSKHHNRTGFLYTGMFYDILLRKKISSSNNLEDIVNTQGFSSLISVYSSSLIHLSEKIKMSLGVNGQLFTLNNHYTIEPRLGLTRELNSKQSIGLGYGLHSRLEKLNYYFNNSIVTGEEGVNKDLDFSKAHHFVFNFNWSLSDYVRIKIEPYYQRLFSIPVIEDSSFSFINLNNDLFFGEKLQNEGLGENYGIDLTLEKSLSKGYYYMATISLFNSQYQGGDGIWYNTRFNRNYVINLLGGKSWQFGKMKSKELSLNGRLSYQGGNRFSPIDINASDIAQQVIYNESSAFTMRSDPTLTIHFTGSIKINRSKTSHEIALKILNVTGTPDFNGHKYNYIENRVDENLASTIIPNISYRIEF